MTVIDAHAHIFPDDLAERAVARLSETYGVQPVRLPTLAGVIEEMDQHGVARACALQVATKPEHVQVINTWALELVSHDRIIPFGALHSRQPREEIAAEIDRLQAGGVRGVKLQPYFQGFDPLSPEGLELFRLIGNRLVVLIHGGEEMIHVTPLWTAPELLARLHDAVPDVKMIIGHLGGYDRWGEVLQHLAGRDVYFDLSFTLHQCPRDLVLRILERHGCDRVVWGSDFPWASMDWRLLMGLGLNDVETKGILSGNLLRFLSL